MARLNRRGVMIGGVAVLAAAGAGVAHMVQSAASQEMTPQEAHEAAKDRRILLVDIRRPDEWQKTGVPEGGVPIDLRRDDFADAVQAARASNTQPVALICARGVRSRRMTLLLDEAGITPIIDVPEGMLGSLAGPGWLKGNLPVVTWNA